MSFLMLFSFGEMNWAQQPVFTKVKARFNRSEKDPRLIDKDADLVLNDKTQKLTVKNDLKPLDIRFEDIQKVTFDMSTHMRGGGMSQLIGGLAGAAMASKHVNDYWCCLEFQTPGGESKVYFLEIDKDASPKIIETMKAILGNKVEIADFPEKEGKIEKETLKDLQSKHDLKVDKKNHPLPELKPDKALVVVVCPALAARHAGKGNQYKLHANDKVVAVNKMGTYSFCYLDPGEYLLVSQTENASGFPIKLEAGKDYYFLQNTFTGFWKARTSLTRHTKQLVMHELSGAYFANWKRKK